MEERAKNTNYVTVVGTQGSGKSLFLAATAQNSVIATNGSEKTIVKGLKADPVLVALAKNPKVQLPTKGRRGVKGTVCFKGISNAWSVPMITTYIFDDRGGAFEQMLAHDFEAKGSIYSQTLSSDFAKSQAVIVVISINQLFNACPHFNPCTCTSQKARNCKHKNMSADCLHTSTYAVKRLISAVYELTRESRIPVSIAVTHSADFEHKIQEASAVLDSFIDDTYGRNYRPNYYFIDSMKALQERRCNWSKSVSLPLCDVLYQLCDKIELNSRGFAYNFVWGNSSEAKADFKRVLLSEIEKRGM